MKKTILLIACLALTASAASAKGPLASDTDASSYIKQVDAAYRHYDNAITLHALPAPSPLDWTSLATLARGMARNTVMVKYGKESHGMGHVSFEIRCASGGQRYSIVTGQDSNKSMGLFAQRAKAGHGYELFYDTVPGRLQAQKDIDREYAALSKYPNEIAYATFLVSPQSCMQAMHFMKDYIADGVYTRYGLGVSPFKGEGGGCANVGVAVLKAAGLSDYDRVSPQWGKTIYLPVEMQAKPGQKIKPVKFLKYLNYHWARKDAAVPSTPLDFYDPELVYNWIVKSFTAKAAPVDGRPVSRYAINKSRGIVVDYTTDSGLPVSWWK